MSSRLFQEVREERGLAYSVYSYRAAYEDAGFLAIYAGTAPDRVHETLGVIGDELDRLVARRPLDGRAGRGQGPHRGFARDVARDVVEPHAPDRPRRAGRRRGSRRSTSSSRASKPSPPTTSRASIDRVLRDAPPHARGRRTARRERVRGSRSALKRAGGTLRADDPGRGVRRRRTHGFHGVQCRASTRRDMELVAAVDPHHAGIDLDQLGVHGTQIQVAGEGERDARRGRRGGGRLHRARRGT